jgi:hypothetical protein
MNVKFMTLLRAIMREKNLERKAITSHVVADWVLKKRRIGDLISSIRDDATVSVPLKKEYCNRNSIERLENAEFFGNLASYLFQKGWTKEAKILYEAILDKTPQDTLALNDYGLILLSAID